MSSASSSPSVAIVVITQGTRPRELQQLGESVAAEPFDERVVIANGADVTPPPGWTVVRASVDLGVPGGRSCGIHNTTSDIVVFLDDDAALVSPRLVTRVRELFAASPRLGAVGFRIVVTGTDRSLKRWIPSHRISGDEPHPAASFLGGGHALDRRAFNEVSGYVDELMFKHEETDLSWRLLDAGWDVGYAPSICVEHPETAESRHPQSLRLGVRNKVWLAKMFLPGVARELCIGLTTTRVVLKARSRQELSAIVAGAREGMGPLPRTRHPISWKTVRELTRRGRPPIL